MIRLSLHPHRPREHMGLPLAKPRPVQAGAAGDAQRREGTDWPLGLAIPPASRPAPPKRGW